VRDLAPGIAVGVAYRCDRCYRPKPRAHARVLPTRAGRRHLSAEHGLDFAFEYAPATTSLITLRARVGPSSGTLRLNGTTASRQYGGVSKATLVLEEVFA
jgi:hypothetical protein